ncbi:MAG: hypothetical protein IKB56_05450, partial [Clostridia bacterium]|nr:hypothetical protein [Clostridia bacterium]
MKVPAKKVKRISKPIAFTIMLIAVALICGVIFTSVPLRGMFAEAAISTPSTWGSDKGLNPGAWKQSNSIVNTLNGDNVTSFLSQYSIEVSASSATKNNLFTVMKTTDAGNASTQFKRCNGYNNDDSDISTQSVGTYYFGMFYTLNAGESVINALKYGTTEMTLTVTGMPVYRGGATGTIKAYPYLGFAN